MTITADDIITVASLLGAISVILGALFAGHRWYLRQAKQDEEIAAQKRESTLIVYALSACLDGLQQLGANHSVTDAKNKLDKYINQQAHK